MAVAPLFDEGVETLGALGSTGGATERNEAVLLWVDSLPAPLVAVTT